METSSVAPDRRTIDRPVGEEEVVPALRHQPGMRGKRPRPMRDIVEEGRIEGHGHLHRQSCDEHLLLTMRYVFTVLFFP
jgi:hypothetical protein